MAVITSAMENLCIQTLLCNEMDSVAWIGAETIANTNEYRWMVNGTEAFGHTFIDSTQNIKLGMFAPHSILEQISNANNALNYAMTVCNNNALNEWNIEPQNSKHYFVIEYELPLLCEESDSVFQILGPKMEYYNAETMAHKSEMFGDKGYLGTILSANEQKCVERLEVCTLEKVWAAASDNSENARPNEWLWKSVYGPKHEMERLFFVRGRPNNKRLKLYSNWDTLNDEPNNLLSTQHHLAVCGQNSRTKWSDQSSHSRFRFLVEYAQSKPLTAPRILQLLALNGGIKILFSEPLNDGGAKVTQCRVGIHPLPITDTQSRYFRLNLVAHSLYRNIAIPSARKHFEYETLYFNDINAVEYETELECANKHGLSPSATVMRVIPIGPPQKPPHKHWKIYK